MILISGTSGSGKSTLSSFLGQRLGITKIVSTDNIRHTLRGLTSQEESPLLWSSTYQAHECLAETSPPRSQQVSALAAPGSTFYSASRTHTELLEHNQSFYCIL